MPDIQVTKTKEEPGEASLGVTVALEHVREAEERATRAYQSRAKLPGFRPGKAPVLVVKRRFADDIRQQTLEDLVRESWKAALAQEALRPIAEPHIHNLKWEPDAPLTFEFHVEVRPGRKLDRLGGVRLKRSAKPVPTARIDPQLNELREQKAPWS